MGIILSLILTAVGAILTCGVNASGGSVNINIVGVVFMELAEGTHQESAAKTTEAIQS